jgi:inner membrane protein
MMAVTHAVIAAAGTSLVLASGDPLVLGLAVVGSQLPDLDTTTSLIGQIFYPLSNWIEERYPHRSVTHSLLATAFIAVVGGLPLYFFSRGKFAERDRAASRSSVCLLLRCLYETGSTVIFP